MVEEYSDEEKEEILDKVYEWGVAFAESKYFEELTEEQKQESEFVVLSFTEYKQIVKNASDPKNWGSAKSFVMAAKEAGVDITNEVEMKKFMVLSNLQQSA